MTGPVLREMTVADLDDVAELDRELFGEEAWSRAMLAGELSQQPASRYYRVADKAGSSATRGCWPPDRRRTWSPWPSRPAAGAGASGPCC